MHRALPALALPSCLTGLNLSEIPGFLLENINVILLKLPLPTVSSPSRSLIRCSSCLCALLLSYFKEYGWFCELKVKWNAFTNMQFKNIGAKVFFIDTIFIEGPMVPCNFFPFHLLRRLTQEHETELWADRCTCWVALSMQTLFLCYKTELDRGMSFPSQMWSASWHPEYTHVWLERRKNCMVLWSVALMTFCHD